MCMNAIKYLQKKYFSLLAHIFYWKNNKKKNIEEVSQVCDFPNVFPEDLPSLPLARQVDFWIDLLSRAPR